LYSALNLTRSILILLLFLCKSLNASPWVGTLEPQLHQDLQTLAEWGAIDVAVTSYPVPWKGIAEQLAKIQVSDLAEPAAIAAQRLKHYLQVHKTQTGQSIISLYAASENSRFTDFDGPESEKAQLNVSREFYAGRWAGQLSANYERGGNSHFDQSFIAYQFGDWNLRLGALDQWWGPTQSSSLILSNNARPVPAISFSRSQATSSTHAWLKHLGPWFITAQLGQLESDRAIPDTKLWMTRFNFKPLSGLEIGFSWSAMWGGAGQGNGFRDFLNVVTFRAECANGQASCDPALDTKLGNHMAGFDFKYDWQLFDRPISLYGQRVGEDAVDYYRVTDNANLIGLSSYFWNTKVYLETSDTSVACSNSGSQVKDCYYEHGTYKSGYRRYDRAIGSTFDSDAKMLSLGFNRHFRNGSMFELVLNRVTLNGDKQQPSPVLKGDSEELLRLAGFYQTQYGSWLLKLGLNLERTEVDNNPSQTDSLVYTELRYRLP
jgi:hypothetical protein